MIVKALTRSVAEQWLLARREGREPPGEPHEIGGPPRGDFEEEAQLVAAELSTLVRVVDEAPRRAQAGMFDAQASCVLHRAFPDLTLQIASDRDFWRYLACGPLFDIVRWRHGDARDPENFGIGGIWGALPERLWFRAAISYSPEAEDPYELTRRGTVDFWASGPIRHVFGGSTALTRALVRFQYPKSGNFTQSGGYAPRTLELELIRELFVRLSHFNAITEFPALSDEEALRLIKSLAEDLLPLSSVDEN